ncbi:hypothetical protein E2C01_018765 [Portunus trituberculatus]|uniref:Uncharacterized protein n=1 Tax=Portunus trituberculatus TaxID=210409 RepID=A0A5B7DXG6_PORTR|nr:hypothetical protein [Portunus trituberculatus]
MSQNLAKLHFEVPEIFGSGDGPVVAGRGEMEEPRQEDVIIIWRIPRTTTPAPVAEHHISPYNYFQL